jgi:hypothetical protein
MQSSSVPGGERRVLPIQASAGIALSLLSGTGSARLHAAVPRRIVGAGSDLRRFVMARSDGKQTGILGRLRTKRDRRRQQRVEKLRIRGDVKRELERSQQANERAYRGGAGGSV